MQNLVNQLVVVSALLLVSSQQQRFSPLPICLGMGNLVNHGFLQSRFQLLHPATWRPPRQSLRFNGAPSSAKRRAWGRNGDMVPLRRCKSPGLDMESLGKPSSSRFICILMILKCKIIRDLVCLMFDCCVRGW